MKRKIVRIDEEKCNGCGACAEACHEGAIEMVNGKARLTREDYCDGLGNCLPECPTGAIAIEEREAAPFNAAAVAERERSACSCREHEHECHGHEHGAHGHGHHGHHGHGHGDALACGCPGSSVRVIDRGRAHGHREHHGIENHGHACAAPSRLGQWPVQIKLVPANAAFLDGARLLVAADCTAFAYGAFHERFIKGRVTLVGCPKLDGEDYSDKLAEIIRERDIRSVSVVRMEVPCCGLDAIVKSALVKSGRMIPWSVDVVTTDGEIEDR